MKEALPELHGELSRSRATDCVEQDQSGQPVPRFWPQSPDQDGCWITGETMAIDGGRHLTCAR